MLRKKQHSNRKRFAIKHVFVVKEIDWILNESVKSLCSSRIVRFVKYVSD